MHMCCLFLLICCLWLYPSVAVIPNPTGNNFTVCRWSTEIIDPSRARHIIPLIVHYPCNKSYATYPIMVFGHGSACSNTWYNYIWEAIVPQGYIVIMPGSYEFLNDSHKLVAADMAYILEYMYDNCNVTSSCKLYGMIMNKSIISGHSMSGAASLLIAGNDINVNETFKYQYTSMMTLSGCGVDSIQTNYTNAAENIHIPSFLLTGSSDCMCNPPYNVSIVGYYNDISSTTCKYLGIITNGTHCHFQDGTTDDEVCAVLEESKCNPKHPPKTTKEGQFEIVNKYFALFMYQTLYANNNENSIQAVKNQLQNDKNEDLMYGIDINC